MQCSPLISTFVSVHCEVFLSAQSPNYYLLRRKYDAPKEGSLHPNVILMLFLLNIYCLISMINIEIVSLPILRCLCSLLIGLSDNVLRKGVELKALEELETGSGD